MDSIHKKYIKGVCKATMLAVSGMFLSLTVYAGNLQKNGCSGECSFSGCNAAAASSSAIGTEVMQFILPGVVILLLAFSLYKKSSKKIYLYSSLIAVALILLSAVYYYNNKAQQQPVVCGSQGKPAIGVLTDTALESEFLPVSDEFLSTEATHQEMTDRSTEIVKDDPETPDTASKAASDEFATVESDEFALATDEFASGEFQAFDNTAATEPNTKPMLSKADIRFLIELGALFGLLIVISFFVHKESFRKFRGLFLLSTVVYLGFIKGGCPCMILSFQNLILSSLGQQVAWISLIWFAALIPLTYFFGKIWCSWLCHLGGLQEFLYRADYLHILKSLKAQAFLRYFRIAVLVILLAQLIVTQTNIFIHYDPFKMAFNLFSANTTGYVLLVILLVLSVLIYRPFCRGFCPVGVALAWVSAIPGARNISKTITCSDCKRCGDVCKSHAIVYEHGKSYLNNHDCIFCGDCLGSCKKNSLTVS